LFCDMHACYLKQIIMPLRMKVVTWSVSFGKYKVKNLWSNNESI